jgi:hypothetical protein
MLADTLPNEPGAADLEQRSHRKQQDRSGDTHLGTSAFVTDQPRLLSYQFTGIDAARGPVAADRTKPHLGSGIGLTW